MAAAGPSRHRFYDAAYKQSVLEEYKRGTKGHGFKALAKRFKVAGGPRVIARWFDKWDGTAESLMPMPKGSRSAVLTSGEVKEHITGFVSQQQAQGETVDWFDVQHNVEEQTGRDISINTLRSYGHRAGVSVKRARPVTEYSSMQLQAVHWR